ncbi:M14 family metallopeptidase [Pseudobacillus sp. FSL P4-0506]|uniref:M14 family metallopeptidase n=1 Tax=Pseudobacillus sp. FSL P4-0506 TaxID=2921576 RepID=UPI0030F671C4
MRKLRAFSKIFAPICVSALLLTGFNGSPAAASTVVNPPIAEEKATLVTIYLKDKKSLDKLVNEGFDLVEHVHEQNGKLEIDAVVTDRELQQLKEKGYQVETVTTQEQVQNILIQRQQKVEEEAKLTAAADEIKILRANYFESQKETFLYIEAKSNAGTVASVILNASWKEKGTSQTATLQKVEDAGAYLYHSLLIPVEKVPNEVTVTSNQGGKTAKKVTEWVGGGKPDKRNKHYVSDFVDHYMNPTEVTDRIEALAKEFPKLAEVVEMPNKTNGYRRKAQNIAGKKENHSSIVISSKAWGHEGGNDVMIELAKPSEKGAPLKVTVDGSKVNVSLATDESGQAISTGNQVKEAINQTAGSLVTASKAYQSTGNGVIAPQTVRLTDSLNAPATVSRDPFAMKALRIGKQRDGSKLGVLAYSQEHAREWVTPLVSVETAERLLRNYATDKETRNLVDNLDIFIVPTVNPDGGHYSFYDYNMQRKNMTNYCEGTEYGDPSIRNSWGVDLNRNHEIGSVYDGYSGASTSCTSGSFAGPEEVSEPEAKNLIWLADQNANIKFAMNIHSYGGYFMWPPGAYKAEGRETLPRPTAGQEAYFWAASNTILDEIKNHRGTVILPSRTGPVPDVLYSAAGNSADALWYKKGIYAWDFEVGADLYDAATGKWQPVGFQPEFKEGHEEAMEFSNGLIGMLKVANDYQKDKKAPASKLVKKKATNGFEVEFTTSEPATVYYTLDGSRPTFQSPTINLRGIRETDGEKLSITKSTVINWFSMDASGNIEKNYHPDTNPKKYNSEVIKIK